MDEVGLEPTNPKEADLQSAVIATRRFVLIILISLDGFKPSYAPRRHRLTCFNQHKLKTFNKSP